jgi:hypothetical protein
LFGSLKESLAGRRFHNNEMKTAVCEWMRIEENDFYLDGIFEVLPSWEKCINVLGNYDEK